MTDLIKRIDYHVHTIHSPCGKMGMEPARILEIFRKFGFESIGFTDHFEDMDFDGILDAIKSEVEGAQSPVRVFYGAEATVISPTECTITPQQSRKLDFLIVAPHHKVNLLKGPKTTARELRDELWGHFLFVCAQDWINAAAHPFHWGPDWHPMMREALSLITRPMLEQAFELARENSVAMELQPKAFGMDPEFRDRFFRTAVRVGVKIWIGSDTHSIIRIGATRDLAPFINDFGITDEMIALPGKD